MTIAVANIPFISAIVSIVDDVLVTHLMHQKIVLLNRLTTVRFWREPKNSHRTQESPPWQAVTASSSEDSTVNPNPMQTGRGQVVGGGVS